MYSPSRNDVRCKAGSAIAVPVTTVDLRGRTVSDSLGVLLLPVALVLGLIIGSGG